MRQGFRQSMAWLHTWSGLVVGWVLFAVFVTGTLSYYRTDITRWMQPELAHAEPLDRPALAAAVAHAVADLAVRAPQARTWYVGVPRPENPALNVYWRVKPGEPIGRATLDPRTGAPAAVRETMGGDFPYLFHFELHMPPLWGRWIVGICAMSMLVALVSGIVTHRRIFADFFTFRRDRSAQRGWLDAHNVVGVLGLPYHLMITYTGFVTLAMMYMPWGVNAAYKGGTEAFVADFHQAMPARRPAGRAASLAPVGPMIEQALAAVPEPLERITVTNPGDANATVIAVFEEPHGLSHEHPQVSFDGPTGAVLEVRGANPRPAAKTLTTMVGLHEGHFAGPALRLLFFLCGLMGCAMVATGLMLWSAARLPKLGARAPFGLRLVQALNIGSIAGLTAAFAVFFLANRLLPLGLADRAAWEVRTFFAAWLAVALIAVLRPQNRAWPEMLALGAILYLAAAAVDAARLAWDAAAAKPVDPFFLSFDLVLLLTAACLFAAARQAKRYAGAGRARTPKADRSRTADTPAHLVKAR